MSGANRSVWKLFVTPCFTAAMRSSPAPVSTEGLGSGLSVPSGLPVELHEHEVPDLEEPSRLRALDERVVRELIAREIDPLAGRTRREAKIARDPREVHVDLRAWPARPRVGHLPEVVLVAQR